MAISKLSSKGQVVLPKAIREALDWRPGLELSIERGDERHHPAASAGPRAHCRGGRRLA